MKTFEKVFWGITLMMCLLLYGHYRNATKKKDYSKFIELNKNGREKND
jgi:hypothetical protein